MTEPLIEARGMAVRLGGAAVLEGIDFFIRPAEIVTVVGPNGAGKTTLLRALVGVVQPSAGHVRRRPGLRVGYVPQRLDLDPTLPITVRRFLDLPERRADAEALAALERTGVPGVAGRQLSELSGGQFRRVLLARALLVRPDILVLDEPTAGLDQPGTAAFYRLVERIRAETGAAVLMVSHDLHVVMSASDRVVCINHHVCCEGAPSAVARAPEYRALFGFGTQGALALYQHDHDHRHDHDQHHAGDGNAARADAGRGEGAGEVGQGKSGLASGDAGAGASGPAGRGVRR